MKIDKNYQKEQSKIQAQFFDGKCGGEFNSSEYPYVLKEEFRKDNLYTEIADKAVEYFKKNTIVWWRGKQGLSTNHTLSSQVACVNHLFWLNENQDAATAVLQEVDNEFTAIPFPGTVNRFVEFELNGCDDNHKNYLGEAGNVRGANSTSIDAAMLAKKGNKTILVFIEWKYVEHYHRKIQSVIEKTKYETQKNTYRDFLLSEECPIILDKSHSCSCTNYDELYQKFSVEPFYQLMRQTLLAWRLTCDKRFDADDYIHVHVIPSANKLLMKCNTSPEIMAEHDNISIAWASHLKDPNRYMHIEPSNLLGRATVQYNKRLHEYLESRYWR